MGRLHGSILGMMALSFTLRKPLTNDQSMSTDAFVPSLASILQVTPAVLTDSYELNGDNWDSVAVMAAIVAIDEHFGIIVPTRELVSCSSIKQLKDLILAHLPPTAGSGEPL